MILKLLLIIAVISIVYFMFIKKKPLQKSNTHAKNESQANDMVECANCGVYVELDEAILSGTKYYCSSNCLAQAK